MHHGRVMSSNPTVQSKEAGKDSATSTSPLAGDVLGSCVDMCRSPLLNMIKEEHTFGVGDCQWIPCLSQVLVTVLSGFCQREHLYPAHMESVFTHFLSHFYILKTCHLNYTCTFAAKPMGHRHEEDSEEYAMGKKRPHGEDEEESFPWSVTEDKSNSGNCSQTWQHGPILGILSVQPGIAKAHGRVPILSTKPAVMLLYPQQPIAGLYGTGRRFRT